MNLDAMSDDEKMDALDRIQESIRENKEIQKQKIAANVDLVIQALRKIESDIQAKYDGVTTVIETRVANIRDGRDGRDGTDGRNGRDGLPGKDGLPGPRGLDGQDGVNGLDGLDGVSVTDARIDFDGSLVIALSSGREINVGEVVPFDLAERIKVITNGGGTSQSVLDALTDLQDQIDGIVAGGLPSQTGNAGKFLTTDGTNASWATVSGGGGISSVASADGSVTVVTTSGAVDLSVATAASTTNLLVQVRNTTGATLTKGTAVYISGATGQIPTVSKALADSDATSAQTLGLMTADLANNSNGYVTAVGIITNINTSAYTDGAQLYLSGTTAGTLTATKPYAPTHLVYIAVVEHAHPTQGKLFVKVQNGYEMDELHNVSAQSPSNGQTLIYNTTTSLWEKANLTAGTGISVSNGAGSITVTNSAPDQTVALTGAGTTTVTGTYPNFTITSTGGSGGGDVSGPASATDNAVVRFDGTTGKIIQNSSFVVNDSGEVTTGIWKGTEITVPYGGTGVATLTGIVKGNGASAFSAATAGTDYAAPTSGTSILYGNGAGGFSNVTVGSGLSFSAGTLSATGGGGGGIAYVVKTANYTASASEGVLTNTSGGAFTVTLPASPSTGAQVYVADSGSAWGTNNLTIGRNGSTIEGSATDLVCDISDVNLQLVYDGTTWQVYSQLGSAGGTLTNQTLINTTITNYTESVVAIGTVTTASTLSLTNGTLQTATLTASTACTFTMPTATAGKSFALLLKQAATTGNGTATFTGVKWSSTGAPTITATAGKMDILNFIADGTNWYGSYTQGYTP